MSRKKAPKAKKLRRPEPARPKGPHGKAGTGSTSRNGRDLEGIHDLLWAAGLTLLAWGHRVFFLLSNRDRDWPFTIFYQGDAQTFFLHARALLAGELYDEGIPFHPPGFPFLLSALHMLLGAAGEAAPIPHRSLRIVLALLSSLAIGLLFLLAKPYVGRAVAALAALLLTYHFGHYVLSVAPVGEGVYLSLLLAALLLWTRCFKHDLAIPDPPDRPPDRPPDHPAAYRAWHGLVLGLLAGAMALLRFESVLIIATMVAVGLWAWGRDLRPTGAANEVDPARSRKVFAGLKPWLLVAVGWLLVVAPWTLRNHRALSDFNARMGSKLVEPLPTFVPVTIYGPINLALANQAGADGSFSPEALTGATGGDALDLTLPLHLEWLLHGDRIAWRWIRENPRDFAHLVTLKWRLGGEVFSLGFTQWNWPGGLDGVRRPVDIFVPEQQNGWWLLPLLILSGWILAFRRPETRRFAVIALLLTGCWLLTTALFYGYVRLALLYLPLWMVLAALPIIEALRRLKVSRRAWAIGISIFIAGLFFLELKGSGANRNYRASASSTVDGHHLNPDDEIVLELLEE